MTQHWPPYGACQVMITSEEQHLLTHANLAMEEAISTKLKKSEEVQTGTGYFPKSKDLSLGVPVSSASQVPLKFLPDVS